MRGVAYLMVPDADRIGKIAARIESPHDGEALNACRMTVERLGNLGLKIGDVVRRGVLSAGVQAGSDSYAPHPVSPLRQHQRDAMEARATGADLTEWESRFLQSMWDQRSSPTDKQRGILADLLRKARGTRQ